MRSGSIRILDSAVLGTDSEPVLAWTGDGKWLLVIDGARTVWVLDPTASVPPRTVTTLPQPTVGEILEAVAAG